MLRTRLRSSERLSDSSVRPTRCQKRRRSPPHHPSDIVFGMKPILLEIVNRLSEIGARVGALEAALVHSRQLTTGDIERLVGAHKANLESQLATLRASIEALPE